MVREAPSSKYRRTRLFVLKLGYIRKAKRLLVFRSSTRIWAELHEKAFRRLGEAPRILVLDNFARRCAGSRCLRRHAQSPLSRHARPLRCGRPTLPDPRSRSKRQDGVSRGPHQENSSERTTLRESGTGASLSGSLGSNMGGYAHSRNHETASGDHVRGRKTNPAPAAGGTVPLLPLRRTGGASGWLCRSRSRLLRTCFTKKSLCTPNSPTPALNALSNES